MRTQTNITKDEKDAQTAILSLNPLKFIQVYKQSNASASSFKMNDEPYDIKTLYPFPYS